MIEFVFEYLKQHKKNLSLDIIIVKDDKEAKEVGDVAAFFDIDFSLLPDIRVYVGDDMRSYQNELAKLNKELYRFYNFKGLLIVPLHTILLRVPAKEYLKALTLEFASTINLETLKEKLFYWGYSFVDIVQNSGEISIRGDIIDIFAINHDNPFRISLFDEEIENIREFDAWTQKSNKEEFESITILPYFISIDQKQYNNINTKIQNIKTTSFVYDIESLGFWAIDEFGIFLYENYNTIFSSDLSNEIEDIFAFGELYSKKDTILSKTILPQKSDFESFIPKNHKEFIEFHHNKEITIIAKNKATPKQYNIDSSKYKIIYKDIILNLISKNAIIISLNKQTSKTKSRKKPLIVDELKIGDYVVHEDYGVGIFKAIEPISVMGNKSDFILVTYQGDDKLYIPAQNLDIIDRYIASTGSLPTLDKLGKSSFAIHKAKVKQKLLEIASKIIDMAAARELLEGIKIDVSFEELDIFVNDAGFEYTKDQKDAIKDIFRDLSSAKVMDRLLNGDVGFGKTEVAMNAIFVVVKSGYQSMFIVPTTLLSSQHYKSLQDRLSHFGIKIAKLDRFTTSKDKTRILQELSNGQIDVVIGTHALFNVKINNLALVIVDEEHKFGVKQKEKLKEFVKNVHFLSMSATPIPRTLNLALSNIKGMSVLKTPPAQRLGVRTFVKEYNNQLLKEIINRELRRGGGIFYIFNSIANIEQKNLNF